MGVIITTAISIILGSLVMKLFDSERRLTGSEVIFASAALCVVLGCLMKWVIELWAEATSHFGLPILPSVFYKVYTPWELVMSPFVQWIIGIGRRVWMRTNAGIGLSNCVDVTSESCCFWSASLSHMPSTSGTPYGANGSASYRDKRLDDFQLRRNADNLHRQGLVLPDADLSAVAQRGLTCVVTSPVMGFGGVPASSVPRAG